MKSSDIDVCQAISTDLEMKPSRDHSTSDEWQTTEAEVTNPGVRISGRCRQQPGHRILVLENSFVDHSLIELQASHS